MLDFSNEAFEAELIPSGTYPGRLAHVKLVVTDSVLLAFSWQLKVPERADPVTVEELACIDAGPGGDPAKAATGRARIRAVLDAHGIAPRFNGYDQLSRAIIGKEMQVVVGRGTKAGLPVAKVVELLPPAAKDE
jgi:hypothetical protein